MITVKLNWLGRVHILKPTWLELIALASVLSALLIAAVLLWR
jgi:hypothetical protein